MAEKAKMHVYNMIPTKLTQDQFNEFFLPHLSRPRKGPERKITFFKTFNYILYFLHTGCQWKCLPVEKNEDGLPEIHYTRIFCRFQAWNQDGSLDRAFEQSVLQLKKRPA